MTKEIALDLKFSDILPYILIFLTKPCKMFFIVNWFVFQGFVTIWKVSFQLVDYLRGGFYQRGPKKIVCLLPLKNSGQIMISNMFPGLML